jgi:hypothetical protein
MLAHAAPSWIATAPTTEADDSSSTARQAAASERRGRARTLTPTLYQLVDPRLAGFVEADPQAELDDPRG